MIDAMYDMDPQIALYTLPLLVAYPIQLLAGSFFAPYLRKYVRTECARLGIKDDDDNNDDGDSETGKSSGDDSSFVVDPIDSLRGRQRDGHLSLSLSLSTLSLLSLFSLTNIVTMASLSEHRCF